MKEIFLAKTALVSKKKCTFAHDLRDVAQLVAHYVRDVGVGRSSRLIPTANEKVADCSATFLFCLIFCISQLDFL